MAEITSVERIREKLKELQGHIDAIIKIRNKVEEYQRDIETNYKQSEELSEAYKRIINEVNMSKTSWEHLRNEVDAINDDSIKTNNSIKQKLNTIEKVINEVEDSLLKATKAAFGKYEVQIKKYENEYKVEIEKTRNINESVNEKIERLEKLINTLKSEFENDVNQWETRESEKINLKLAGLQKNLLANISKYLNEYRNSVQEEMIKFEGEQDQKRLEFMNRHETVFKNINIQMETFSRTSLTFNGNLESTKKDVLLNIEEMKNSMTKNKDWIVKYIDDQIQKREEIIEERYQKKISELEEEILQIKKKGLFGKILGKK